MLSSILTGKQKSVLVCIQDSLEQSGFPLLKAFVQHAVDRKENHVHIICYEHPTGKMKNGLKNSGEDHVHFHDCFTDHRGWIERLAVSQVVCLVHKDTLPDAHAALPQLCHLAATIVRVGPFTQSSRGNPIAHIIHKKQGGKVLKRAEYYFIDADNRVKSEDLTVVVPTTTGMNKEMIDDSNLPQNLTTFKLSLGQQEKQARSQLVLPYLRRVNSEKGGEVFYQPDAADDWDEEDPDDDLDI
ncbi:elongator complex protein 5 isoform X3 [Zootermopsis nevadensis]|uniref:elongator complex protein 5 isoform X3 n=1 Tax=Zootermopsis nevadensis TaxID=136037 RepID=UPI000B8E5E74|nr:elongator complex protein 5 isoform X3 [Zootermopsis nevadensis]